jgi:ribosomal protein S18 acetylase RimI-like enzyme
VDVAALARELEEIAANAWPASIVQHVDGWRLRATPGTGARRSNSVLPLGGHGRIPVDDKLAIADEFYGERGLPVRFQLSPAADPPTLDDLLAQRGYEVDIRVDIQVADLAEVTARSARQGVASTDSLDPEPGDEWLDVLLAITARGERETFRAAVLDRIAPPARYAAVRHGDRIVAVGMGVIERGWLGIFSMATVPEARRRGAATTVLHMLAKAGANLGATRAYLQTESTNDAAHTLYEGLGFSTAYGYHWRTKRGGAATTP